MRLVLLIYAGFVAHLMNMQCATWQEILDEQYDTAEDMATSFQETERRMRGQLASWLNAFLPPDHMRALCLLSYFKTFTAQSAKWMKAAFDVEACTKLLGFLSRLHVIKEITPGSGEYRMPVLVRQALEDLRPVGKVSGSGGDGNLDFSEIAHAARRGFMAWVLSLSEGLGARREHAAAICMREAANIRHAEALLWGTGWQYVWDEPQEHAHVATQIQALIESLLKVDQQHLAKGLSRCCVAMFETALGTTHSATARSLTTAGMVLAKQGKLVGAAAHYRSAMSIYDTTVGASIQERAACLHHLAGVLQVDESGLPEAETNQRGALILRQDFLGSSHPDTAEALVQLGSILERQGRLLEAQSAFQQGLQTLQELPGAPNTQTAMALTRLGSLHLKQQQLGEAEQMYRQATAIIERVLGPWHPTTAGHRQILAVVLFGQGQHDHAEAMFRHVLDVREQVVGTLGAESLLSLDHLGAILLARNELAEAQSMFCRAMAIQKKLLRSWNIVVASSAFKLVVVLMRQAEPPAAGDYWRNKLRCAYVLCGRALDIRNRVLGRSHRETLICMGLVATLEYRQGTLSAAMTGWARLKHGIASSTEAFGREDPLTTALQRIHDGWQQALVHCVATGFAPPLGARGTRS